jgi:hypothetical protein
MQDGIASEKKEAVSSESFPPPSSWRLQLIYEYVGDLHVHSSYSDGHATHDQIALAALKSRLDFVVITDHNIWVDGYDGYRYLDDRRVLLLTGEEIHDQAREPQKNHLLVFETQQELAPYAREPQRLINMVKEVGGQSFIAHPNDPEAPAIGESDLSWVDWDVHGFTGLEIWNFMSEFKSHIKSIPRAIFYAYNPTLSAMGPFPEVLERWDRLLAAGKRVVAIGGTDAHAMPIRKGPLYRVIFPYEWLFRTVNTHILTKEPLTGNAEIDRKRLFSNLERGQCFVGYDLPASTMGFRFTAQGDGSQAIMGETITARFGVTLQVKLPSRANINLLCNGMQIRQWEDCEAAVHTVIEPGAYRVEVYRSFQGKTRGWIFSNPIFVSN